MAETLLERAQRVFRKLGLGLTTDDSIILERQRRHQENARAARAGNKQSAESALLEIGIKSSPRRPLTQLERLDKYCPKLDPSVKKSQFHDDLCPRCKKDKE